MRVYVRKGINLNDLRCNPSSARTLLSKTVALFVSREAKAYFIAAVISGVVVVIMPCQYTDCASQRDNVAGRNGGAISDTGSTSHVLRSGTYVSVVACGFRLV